MMTRYTTEEAQYRAMLSQQEANEFVERELCCPYCGYIGSFLIAGLVQLTCSKAVRV